MKSPSPKGEPQSGWIGETDQHPFMPCSQQALLQRLRIGYIAALTVIVAALVVSGLTIYSRSPVIRPGYARYCSTCLAMRSNSRRPARLWYARASSRVRLTGGLRFEVRDSGIGISPDARSRLFHAFSQSDGSTTRRFGGTGLGLAISKQLVELMGGHIGYDSTPGQGSRFCFTLPFVGRDATPPALPAVSRGRLIVAAAHDPTRESILTHATCCGVEGSEARNAEGLLAQVQAVAGSGEELLLLIDHALPDAPLSMLLGRLAELPAAKAARICILLPDGKRTPTPLPHPVATLTRPLRRSTFLREISMPRSHPAAPAASPRILVVEDNPVNRAVAGRHLRKLGYRVEMVSTGSEALARIGTEQFDLALIDCQMPGMDDFETTRAIRALESPGTQLPIVALTAEASPEDRVRCRAAGMDGHLAKPFHAGELRDMIRGLLQPSPDQSRGDFLS